MTEPQPTASRVSTLSASERAILSAVAEATMPAGDHFPAAGPRAIEKVERFLADLPGALQKGYRALLWSLDAQARLTTLRAFKDLSPERRCALLEKWHESALYGRRMALRALLTPLKVAHYNDPDFYQALGCTYGTNPPQVIEQPRYMKERVTRGDELEADQTVEVDAVVVGTGAGGAVVARELAEQGHAVAMVEEGAYFTRKDFTGQTFDMQRMMYRDFGATGAVGNTFIPIPIGKTVGGSTTINSGTCFRVPGRVLAKWQTQFGLTSFTEDELGRHYDRVEEVLGVAPNEAKYLGAIARMIAKGCDKLGYSHGPLRRNAPACDGQGLCCFGCPTDAKRSTNVSYVPLALKAGAQLFTGVKVVDIVRENGRAVGVVGVVPGKNGQSVRLTVRARVVVLACGSFHTPVLLETLGLAGGSGQLGRNLSIHPAIAVAAEFGELIQAFNGVPQGYSIDEFHGEGMLFEGGMVPLDMVSSLMTGFGKDYVRMMERFDRVGLFGCMIEDTSRGRVRAVGGRPVATYFLNAHDTARLKRAIEILSRVYFAAGAKRVFPMVHNFYQLDSEADLARFRRAKLGPRDFDISAYHPLGTARLGMDPRASVVGPDHQVHDVPGLYITDGSAVPSSLAVNPQLTIMALATRAAELIGARLERRERVTIPPGARSAA